MVEVSDCVFRCLWFVVSVIVDLIDGGIGREFP